MGKVENIIKTLISEMAKEGSADEAEKDTGIPKKNIEVGKVTFSKDGDTKFTVTDIDDETGRVSWNVERLPSYEELFSDATWVIFKTLFLNLKRNPKFFVIPFSKGSISLLIEIDGLK